MAARRILMPAGSAGIFRFYGEESKGPRISATAIIFIAFAFIIGVIILKKLFA